MEIQRFKPKQGKDLLASTVESLVNTTSEQEFYFLISQRLRGGKGKEFKDFNKIFPEGRYQELEVNGSQDSRRIVIDMDEFKIYPTRNHYATMTFAGNPLWAQQ